MTKLGSSGYAPNPSRGEQRQRENEALGQNLKLILAHSAEILRNERYFYCYFGTAFLSVPYIWPDGPIPLGVLITLWQRGEFVDKCRECGGRVYMIGLGGSPLSGSHSWWGRCAECGRHQDGSRKTFREIWEPLRELLIQHLNEPVIQRGKRPKFSWSKGLVGETTPDIVIKPRVEGVSLATLIEELEQKDREPGEGT